MQSKLMMFGNLTVALGLGVILASGCSTADEEGKQDEFFTSGSREADQRATQRMAKDQQLSGTSDEGKGKKNAGGTSAEQEKTLTLYERLGGEEGITAIVDDFVPRAIQDPRVNWERKGVKRGGFLFRRDPGPIWDSTPQNVSVVKKHMIQFLSLATGGPARYDGKEMKASHSGMEITNAEFDAAIGDLKATLDRLQIADREQKELLAIVETTRPQVVSVR